MSTSLLEALSSGAPEKKDDTNIDFVSGEFAKKVDGYKNMVVDGYMRNSIDVNRSIARIAQKETLNDDQISRIIEEVNNQIYLLKYNQMKSSIDREVSFDIASLSKIKGIIKSGEANKPINQQKEASSIDSAFEKTASEGEADGLNFLNYSSHQMPGLRPEKVADRKVYLEKKIFEKIAVLEEEVVADMQKTAGDIYTIAEAFIKYDRSNIQVQPIFENMCKQANFRKADQVVLRSAIDQKVAQLKEYRVLPGDYIFNVDLVDIEKVADEFSLGMYSFMDKLANDKGSNQKVPVVVTDKKTVRSVDDILSLARSAVDDNKKTAMKQKELEDTKKKIVGK